MSFPRKVVIIGLFVLWAGVFCAVHPGAVQAQQTLSIDIYGPGQHQLNMFVAAPMELIPGGALPPQAAVLADQLQKCLGFMPFLRLVSSSEVLGGASLAGVTAQDIDFRRFRLDRVDLVLSTGWGPSGNGPIELRVYETFEQRLVLGKAYTGVGRDELPDVASRFCADLMAELTGQGDFFRSRLAVVKAEGQSKEVWSATSMGADMTRLTDFGAISMSPNWSRDGRHLVFTLIDEGRHYLGVRDNTSGVVRKIHLPGNSVISPVYNARGQVVVSLNPEGRSDIYTLDDELRIDDHLVSSWAIDISPSFDASGEKMAFVSSRLGNPHIFIMDTASGQARRVTYAGKYNTNPSLSPDGSMVVFSRQTDNGHRIFLHDLATGREKQLTFGPRNDVSPAWAPDNFYIAFSSNRSGEDKIYLTTRHGTEPRMVPLGPGAFTSPAWVIQE